MESVMSSFRLFMATSIGARQPQSVQGNLNLCRATSICAKQPQSVQNNLNSCKTTSIRAEKKNPKSNGLFQEAKTNFRTRNFFSGQGIYIKNTFRKKNGGKASNLASAVAETVCPPCIRGRHPQLDYLTRPKKSSWATNYGRHGVKDEIITIFVLPDDDDEGINEEATTEVGTGSWQVSQSSP